MEEIRWDINPRKMSVEMGLSSCITLFRSGKIHLTLTLGWQSDVISVPER
jgi:hypothetical protein